MDSVDAEPQIVHDTRMDTSDDAPEEVILESDDNESGSESDADLVELPTNRRPLGKPLSSTTSQKRPERQPDFIDLTKDDDNDDDDDEDDVMVTDSIEPAVAAVPNAGAQAMDDDMPELIEVEPISAQQMAEDRKKKGNEHFKTGEYYQALEMYTKAIEAMPTEAQYYGNRSACYMMLKRYKEALSDIRESLNLDPNYEKGYLRLIRTTLILGNVKECELAFETVSKKGLELGAKPEHERLFWLKRHLDDIEKTKAKKDFRKLIFLISQALEVASADNDLKMMKADALIRLGRHTEAQELCTEVLQNDRMCAEALYIRAVCLYLDDNLDKGIQFVRQALQYAPDNSVYQSLLKRLRLVKDLRESGSSKFQSSKFEEARLDYTQCLSVVSEADFSNMTIQSKLQFNLALIAHRQNKIDESLEFCKKAIELNSSYLKAIIHRARMYSQKEMFDDAVHDYEAALRIDPTLRDLKRELQNTKLAAKKAKRKDYYKILNVDKNATEDEIRKAYKKRALLHHPDRHANATEAVQKDQERQFKELREAYEVLSDSKKRFRYDQGVDLMEDRGFEPSYDSSADLFNVFFANGGIPTFRPGQTAGSRGHHQQFHHSFRH